MTTTVAHLVVHRAVTREVVSSREVVRLRPDQHSGSLNNCGESAALVHFIFLVIWDNDAKLEVPSHNSLNVDNFCGT